MLPGAGRTGRTRRLEWMSQWEALVGGWQLSQRNRSLGRLEATTRASGMVTEWWETGLEGKPVHILVVPLGV